jgi:hypothetical protein
MTSTYYSNPYFYNETENNDSEEPWFDDNDPISVKANRKYHEKINKTIKEASEGIPFPTTHSYQEYNDAFKKGFIDYNCVKCLAKKQMKIDSVITIQNGIKTQSIEYFIRGHCIECLENHQEFINLR